MLTLQNKLLAPAWLKMNKQLNVRYCTLSHAAEKLMRKLEKTPFQHRAINAQIRNWKQRNIGTKNTCEIYYWKRLIYWKINWNHKFSEAESVTELGT